ncbi:GntR family transcriptional regulator [Sporosarcina saromensis]|uniref:GntR family transcriptional regulator n=1 Tax=Sporosarcina saromensis TaxID=359365 RepID=A0ABU4G653_9BACL|nr:GntR family transcriptional regulator [Sporosarcina saromensis]MDW0112460.1 GntR family transcriptional regulator [Sporosarcina saromensis]
MSNFIVKKTTLKEQVYEYLKNAITTGEIGPGDRLIEEKVSETLQVSRSPIREAVRMLEKDGLLNVHGSGGVTVVNPTVEDYRNLYETRVEMESLAAYYAAQRRTDKELAEMQEFIVEMQKNVTDNHNVKGMLQVNFSFHEAIVRASQNPFLISMTLQLRGVNSFYRKAILEGNPSHMREALQDHLDIFQAIDRQQQDEARESMRRHIERDFQSFMKVASK